VSQGPYTLPAYYSTGMYLFLKVSMALRPLLRVSTAAFRRSLCTFCLAAAKGPRRVSTRTWSRGKKEHIHATTVTQSDSQGGKQVAS